MPSQYDITIRVVEDKNKICGFDITKGEKVDSKDYASFIASYFDYQARVEFEKQKTEQEKQKLVNTRNLYLLFGFVALLLFVYIAFFYKNTNSANTYSVAFDNNLSLAEYKIDKKDFLLLQQVKSESNKTK
jgi:hypothetical protein